LDIDSYLGVHAQALQLQSRRTELLASNLANADTPGYKARDIDFRAALAAAGFPGNGDNAAAPLQLQRTGVGHTAGTGATVEVDGAVKYRVPLEPALDGNTVDAQLEQAAFAENSVRYQATLTILNARLRGLLTAITGQ
jgi:flagellar basal-body rod protein FlgB